MKNLIITLSIILVASSLYGQTDFKRNFIYIEAGGNGLFASVNYEKQLTKNPGIGLRLGMGYYSEKAFYLTIPIGINYLFQLKNKESFIDAGIGLTWARVDGNLFGKSKNPNVSNFTNFIPSIGYRKHSVKNFIWRISATPVFNRNDVLPWLGLSVGKAF